MTRIEWRDLSDGELMAKLEQRGVTRDNARLAVHWRETPGGIAMIERVMKP